MCKFIFISLFLLVNCFAYSYEIALTFDDLPGQQPGPYETWHDINCKILNALEKYQAPAIGFVNEGASLWTGTTEELTKILQLWVDHGFPLGNHTYSHKYLSATPLHLFQEEVLRGSLISKQLMQKANLPYRYFRHPYLDTGKSKLMRSSFETFLKKEGYTIAPITLDTNDWRFNLLLLKDPQTKDKIVSEYLDGIKKQFAYCKKYSIGLFGRNIKHVCLLHVNLLNSIVLEKVLQTFQELGCTFITLDQALKDKAYSSPDRYYSENGVSWLYRWQVSRRHSVRRSRPRVIPRNRFDRKKNRFKAAYQTHRFADL